jgi:hypothetical protein
MLTEDKQPQVSPDEGPSPKEVPRGHHTLEAEAEVEHAVERRFLSPWLSHQKEEE